MDFNVSQLMKEPSGSVRNYEVDETVALKDKTSATRVAGKVRFLKTDKGVWVSAALDCDVECTCSRCLTEYQQPVHMDIEEEFFPEIDVITGLRLHQPTEIDEDFYINQNHILDLTEAIRQYAELSAPMKPICDADCVGLCLTCGVNLNETACVCDKTPRDPRWGALLELVPTRHSNN